MVITILAIVLGVKHFQDNLILLGHWHDYGSGIDINYLHRFSRPCCVNGNWNDVGSNRPAEVW